jgi:hypothetical protein
VFFDGRSMPFANDVARQREFRRDELDALPRAQR